MYKFRVKIIIILERYSVKRWNPWSNKKEIVVVNKTRMSVSMGQLVNDAKDLVMRLKEREKNVDTVVTQSNALAKKVDAIQQVDIYILLSWFLRLFLVVILLQQMYI